MTTHRQIAAPRLLLNKVPQITVYFWVIKVLCTTVGETAADFLNVNLNFGLTGTSVVTGALLVVALIAQLCADRYRPGRYWTAVTLVSVFGTLVTDNLTDALGVPLEVSTVVYGALLAIAFGAWFAAEPCRRPSVCSGRRSAAASTFATSGGLAASSEPRSDGGRRGPPSPRTAASGALMPDTVHAYAARVISPGNRGVGTTNRRS